jgi:hypothetical protein
LRHMSAERVVRIAARHSHYSFGGEKEWGENRKQSAKLTVSMAAGLLILEASIVNDVMPSL